MRAYDVQQAAERYGISEDELRAAISQKRLPSVEMAGQMVVLERDLSAYVDWRDRAFVNRHVVVDGESLCGIPVGALEPEQVWTVHETDATQVAQAIVSARYAICRKCLQVVNR